MAQATLHHWYHVGISYERVPDLNFDPHNPAHYGLYIFNLVREFQAESHLLLPAGPTRLYSLPRQSASQLLSSHPKASNHAFLSRHFMERRSTTDDLRQRSQYIVLGTFSSSSSDEQQTAGLDQ